MDVSAAGLSASGTTADVAAKKLSENYDTFLTLLTTQLKNQDPLQPTDSNEFVRQLVQFSEVEQSITTNKSLDKLLALQTSGQAIGAMSYIGNTIEALGDTAPLQNGTATYTYAFDKQADSATVGIYNSDGQLVSTAVGETTLGKHTFVWDGLDINGNPVPEGSYKIAVAAKDADGNSLQAATGVVARVTGVDQTTDGTLLSLSGVRIPITSVLSVTEAPGTT